jgi:hypothetical protein
MGSILTLQTTGAAEATMSSRTEIETSKRVSGLYLCQFSQGTIKIGMGLDVAARLASHRSAGAAFGISVVRTDIVPCDHPKKAEKLLIEWCAGNSTACNGREWFNGVDYQACLAAAKSAVSAMMGPYPYKAPKPDILDALTRNFKGASTKEADLYREVRAMMFRNQIPTGVLAGFDYVHAESEKVRAALRLGASKPDWYDLLNCFEFWEVELWFDQGAPSPELLRALADAIGSIERIKKIGDAAHA